MISIIQLIEKHKHPLSWLYISLFYLNLFVGLWLHNWLLIVSSLIGVVTVMCFQPAMKEVPIWSERLIEIVVQQWEDSQTWLLSLLIAVGLAATAVLFWALWQNSLFFTTVSLLAILAVKGFFMQKPLCKFYGCCASTCSSIKSKLDAKKDNNQK